MLDDLKSALRSLRARPGVAAAAVLCLSLGIGVNVALFGVVDALLLRPPPGVAHPERLVRVRIGSEPVALARGSGPAASFPQFVTVRREWGSVLEDIAAYGRRDGTVGYGPDASPVHMVVVTSDYFTVLGVHPRMGRFFDAAEGEPGGAGGVAVLSYRYWKQAFGGEGDVLGRQLPVNGVSLTVVGVAPEGFVGADLGDPDLWVPAGLVGLPQLGGGYGEGAFWLQLIGRLHPGVPLTQAQAQARGRAPASDGGEDPWVAKPFTPRRGDAAATTLPISLLPLRTMFFERQRGTAPVPLWTLGISLAVLLLSCGTVANLLLAQAVTTRRDVAIRLALGSSRGRIVRSQFLQSLVLAGLSAAASAGMAGLFLGALRSLPLPPLPEVMNLRTAAFALAVSALTPLVFGMAPALWASRRTVGEAMKTGDAGGMGASRIQTGFMVAQIAISFSLVLVGGLFLRSLLNARDVDAGMDLDRVVLVYEDMRSRVGGAPGMDVVVPSLERLRRLPGVEEVAVGGTVPFFMFTWGTVRLPDGRAEEERLHSVLVNPVGPDYFAVMGTRLVEGRGFEADDREGSPPVAVVSAKLARELWPGASPLGACLDLAGDADGGCTRVVGVTADVRLQRLTGEPNSVLYLPLEQAPHSAERATVFLRTRGDPAAAIPAIRRAVQSLDPGLQYLQVETLDSRVRPQLMEWEVGSRLFVGMGILAALLAAAGLYMVIAFHASQRMRELGIRSALGAGRERLVALLLVRSLKVSGLGIGCGVVLALAAGSLLRRRFYGVAHTDALTFLTVAGVMLALAVAASLRPASRAARADPGVVLRGE